MDDTTKSLVQLFNFTGYDRGFDRPTCQAAVQVMLQSRNPLAVLVSKNDTFFFRSSSGLLENNTTNPQLTQWGCKQLCGSKMGLYPNTPIRLFTWFLPAILLVTNMQFAPLGKAEFFTVMQLFGNPVDFVWTLLVKVEEWSRCRRFAEELFMRGNKGPLNRTKTAVLNMATILSAIRELAPGSKDHFRLDESISCPCVEWRPHHLYDELATTIIDSKTHDTLRSIFSIVLYMFGVISSFFNVLGGSSTPSGTILFPAMLLSWILPTIILNNVVGQFKSSEDCLQVIWMLEEGIQPHFDSCFLRIGDENNVTWMKYIHDKGYIHARRWKAYLRSQSWRSGTSNYLCKSQYPLINNEGIPDRFVCFALSPVALSFAVAFYVLYSPPTNFTCRHNIVLSSFAAWLLSPIASFGITKFCKAHERTRFILILLKDSIIAISVLSLLIMSSCGVFNNCWCWSGNAKGHPVVLDAGTQFAANDKRRYPETVGITLIMQIFFFGIMYWQEKRGFDVMRRSKGERRNALERQLTRRRLVSRATQADLSDSKQEYELISSHGMRIAGSEIIVDNTDDAIEVIA